MDLLLDTLLGLWVAASIAAALFRSIRLASSRPESLVAPATPAGGRLAQDDGADFSRPNTTYGGTSGSLRTDVPTSTSNVFTEQILRFDMSDLQSAACGGTVGQDEWEILHDLLEHSKNVTGTATALEQAATRAYGRER